MFMMSFRLKRGNRIVLGAVGLALAAVIGIKGAGLFATGGAVTAGAGDAAASAELMNSKKVQAKTNEQRLAFIRSYGWEVEPESTEILEVIIPKEFDTTYAAYNSIQKKQGFDLEKYAGKRCKRYSYVVTNYPDATGEIRINLLVYKNKIIGGDVSSMELEGFMHGFTLPD